MKIGDKVEVIDEALSGIVMDIQGEVVTFETLEGFPMKYQKSELIVAEEELEINAEEVIHKRKKEEKELRRNKKPPKSPKKNQKPLEVDLHIHQLRENVKNLSNFEMLNIQLDTVRGQLHFAMKKNIRRVVFIHGIGEGVLRKELETLLRRYDNVKFYDAEFKKYGFGATEVYIFQNR